MRFRLSIAPLALVAALLAAPAHAVVAEQVVEREIVIQNPDGTEVTARQPAAEVAPGDRVVYTVRYTNDTSEPAEDIVLTQPVPPSLTFVEGSADRAGTSLSVSVDGGLTFGPRGAAMVERNGQMLRAGASDITHVRWTLTSELAPGESGEVAYKGVLN